MLAYHIKDITFTNFEVSTFSFNQFDKYHFLENAKPWKVWQDEKDGGWWAEWEGFKKDGAVKVECDGYDFYYHKPLIPFTELQKPSEGLYWQVPMQLGGVVAITPASMTPRQLLLSLTSVKAEGKFVTEYGKKVFELSRSGSSLTDLEKNEIMMLAIQQNYRVTPELLSAYGFLTLPDRDRIVLAAMGEPIDPKALPGA